MVRDGDSQTHAYQGPGWHASRSLSPSASQIGFPRIHGKQKAKIPLPTSAICGAMHGTALLCLSSGSKVQSCVKTRLLGLSVAISHHERNPLNWQNRVEYYLSIYRTGLQWELCSYLYYNVQKLSRYRWSVVAVMQLVSISNNLPPEYVMHKI